MKNLIIVVVLLGVIIIVAFAIFSSNPGVGVTSDQAVDDQNAVENGVGDFERVTPTNQKSSAKKRSKLFVESIAKINAPVVADDNVDQEYSNRLKAALAGDLAMVVEILALQKKCHTLRLYKKYLDHTYIRNSEGMSEGEIEQEMTMQRNRKHQKFEQDRRQCISAFNDDYDSELGQLARHDELYQQALAGNVMAKYIYAIQTHTESYLTELFIRDIDFETVARDFSNENLIERPYLGLLAYGQSYTTGGQFTPIRYSIGIAYLIAAGICGADPEVINSFPALKFLSNDSLTSFLAPTEKILTLADTLSQQYCPL